MTSGGTFSGPAGIVFVSTSTGEIDLAASTSGGPYTITHATNGVCPNATTFDITINAEDDASFSYTEISYCQGDVSPVPTAVTSGGTYSGPVEIVFFTTTPGKVNLPASTVGGPYTITYQTSGVCPNSSTFDITILPTDDASFNYGPTSYCINDQNPTPTTSLPGGSFSAGIGLVFANTSTGEINLSASTPGTYTVTYTTNGACPNFATQSITIRALETVTFEYDASVFCVSDANQFPSVSPTGGTYEVSTGLSLVDAGTGEVSPNLSITEVPHTVQYTSSGACPNTVEIPITINAASIADAGVDIELPFLFSTELSAVAPTIGLGNWNTSSEYTIETTTDPQSPITDLNIGLNEAVWVVENGTCPAAMDTVIINVLDLWIPEAVTPNDDGKNDFFAFRSLDEATCHLQILNRWGQIVFESEDYQNDWQGNNMNGALQPADTYFYIAIINNEQTYKGYVVLKR
jgi:gliding motility-associated-like protein